MSSELLKKGKDISIISNHTIKPLDINGILNVLNKYKKVLVLEEMSAFGGLSNMIKTIGFDTKTDCEIDTVTLKDEFIHCYGSHQDILSSHNLTEEIIFQKLNEIMDQIQFPPITSNLEPCNAVACILHTKDLRILMNLRDNKKNIFYSNHWGLFGGGVEKGETYLQALKREIYEETNLKINNFDFFSECILDFSMFFKI